MPDHYLLFKKCSNNPAYPHPYSGEKCGRFSHNNGESGGYAKLGVISFYFDDSMFERFHKRH